MRGLDERTVSLFSYVDLEDCVPAKHSLRVIRRSHDAPLGLCDQPAKAQADRGAVRLGQDDRRACPAHVRRSATLTIHVHSDDGGLRSHLVAQVARSVRITGRTLSRTEAALAKPNIIKSICLCETLDHDVLSVA